MFARVWPGIDLHFSVHLLFFVARQARRGEAGGASHRGTVASSQVMKKRVALRRLQGRGDEGKPVT